VNTRWVGAHDAIRQDPLRYESPMEAVLAALKSDDSFHDLRPVSRWEAGSDGKRIRKLTPEETARLRDREQRLATMFGNLPLTGTASINLSRQVEVHWPDDGWPVVTQDGRRYSGGPDGTLVHQGRSTTIFRLGLEV
jgi:hypothetical protein